MPQSQKTGASSAYRQPPASREMSVRAAQSKDLWMETPLVYPTHISDICLPQKSKEKHGPSVHLVIASSGNAGLAVAVAARALGALRKKGADIPTIGEVYTQSLAALRDAMKKYVNGAIIATLSDPF
ncbi:hypothetical protein DFH29DRAFT_1000547 [Suillus ampliporus]|nr:hypothetical protein DFH29DRAFT_1000547 [Suillus ampliporus]